MTYLHKGGTPANGALTISWGSLCPGFYFLNNI